MKTKLLLILFAFPFLLINCKDDNNDPDPTPENPTISEMYFPPSGNDWATVSTKDLGWDENKLNALDDYLRSKKTKGFIILKNGRIAHEKYYNGHSGDKNWQWFSAAKSFTSVMVGIAQEEGYLSLEDKSSQYLGDGWTSLSKEKEDLIQVKHHLAMTTGFDYEITDLEGWTCTAPSCFTYKADAGTRWAYHQGAFTKTQDIITEAVGKNFKSFAFQNIQQPIGMNGTWLNFGNLRIFYSTTRSMARFGLLTLNEGQWDSTMIYSKDYHAVMINSSQEINPAYGYLWWLNGKSSFVGTIDSTSFPGKLIPNGPDDMYCALGAQDQKIYVVPSQNLVVIRMGESAGNTEFASSSFDNELWGKLNEIME